MNGWAEGHPAWWRNLQADPRGTVVLSDGSSHAVLAHRADGEERQPLWDRWLEVNPGLDQLAAVRHTPTDVVVLTRQ
ncbi:nitroreductase/quinone reductase family protein [Ruania zhangjianzhongii]|uniref:nitroreductase/quinone reductase family protein n=1 Tax=Ruania zhangjianzhongii TaxID=2603206 RepID=UPI001AF00600|nr:nitroreductase/quinone reductase family protein [Ruania zhangjianzhongii]